MESSPSGGAGDADEGGFGLTSTEQSLVGIGELLVMRSTGELVCLGLGSCVGVCGYDPQTRVGGMIHVMLPESFPGRVGDKPAKFADAGVPRLVDEMARQGADPARSRFAIAGGARIFETRETSMGRLDIGTRNAEAVLRELERLGKAPVAFDTGGHVGRAFLLSVDTGEVRVRTAVFGERSLCALRN